jgi:Na+/melibiose symporter-like transporter
MTFLEFLWLAFLSLLLVVLIVNMFSLSPINDDSAFFCNSVCIVILTLVFLISAMSITREPVIPNPKLVTFWNRSIHKSTKTGLQITEWRKPDITLSAQEYLMGVELAKSNACHYFNFGNEADITRFKRCTHFFPEMLAEYTQHHQAHTGVLLNA